jgi:hypothetical protein
MKCERCGEGVVGKSHWQKVEGWVQKRSGGGSNHIAQKNYAHQYLCHPCMVLLKAGYKGGPGPHPGQQTLT